MPRVPLEAGKYIGQPDIMICAEKKNNLDIKILNFDG